MFRTLALVLTAALTFTPAVVGACAAWLCGPGGAVAMSDHREHTGLRQTAAPASSHDHAIHSHAGHGGVHTTSLQGEPVASADHAHATHRAGGDRASGLETPVRHIRGLSELDCCSWAAITSMAPAIVSGRSEMAPHGDAATRSAGIAAVVSLFRYRQPPSPPDARHVRPVSSSPVLRI